MAVTRKALAQVTESILELGARRATKILSDRLVVKACRRHRPDRRSKHTEILVTVGTPNYAERRFIMQAKRAGEPFPIKKVQLKWYK